ncbi:hypothetical protein LNQ81_00210 [Myroides sp. M-43]|uniref:hypothetical protein n=1 Tax=Myroides oncorhynchi TaxID=2893756 RepID=UPI001E5D6441|nr:hypothetical protein [Myroides oncorhynchi]MCC9041162.1 hypothetical protein [Myroides oncorhynchi]
MIIKRILLIVPFLFISCLNKKEEKRKNISTFDEKCRLLVLNQNEKKKEFVFEIKDSITTKLNIEYLGNIITSKGDTIKVINSTSFSGELKDSNKANANVFLYSNMNKNVGYYYVGSINSLPNEVENNFLVFKYNDEICDKKTLISLKDSIPAKIFVLCKEDQGDIYLFKNCDEK